MFVEAKQNNPLIVIDDDYQEEVREDAQENEHDNVGRFDRIEDGEDANNHSLEQAQN